MMATSGSPLPTIRSFVTLNPGQVSEDINSSHAMLVDKFSGVFNSSFPDDGSQDDEELQSNDDEEMLEDDDDFE